MTEDEKHQLIADCAGAGLTVAFVHAQIMGWQDIADEAERLRSKVFQRIDEMSRPKNQRT